MAVVPRLGSAVTDAGRVPVGTIGSTKGTATAEMTGTKGPTLRPPLETILASISPDFPFVETNTPARSKVLTDGTVQTPATTVTHAGNTTPAVGLTGPIAAFVAAGVPKPMTIVPALLLMAE